MAETVKAAPKFYNATRDAVLAKLKHDHAGNGVMYRLYGFATLLVVEHGMKVGSDHLANLLALTHENETIGESTARSIRRFPGQMIKLLKATDETAFPRMPATATVDDVVAWIVAARDFVGARRAADMSRAIDDKIADLEATAARAAMPEELAAPGSTLEGSAKPPEVASAPPASVLSHRAEPAATGSGTKVSVPAEKGAELLSAGMAIAEAMSAEDRYTLILGIVGTLPAAFIEELATDLVALIAPPSTATAKLAEAA